MGRSKFPGKPSKLQNRKRISVLTGVIICDSDISITEDCNNQLSILKGTFRGQDVENDEEINKNLPKQHPEGTTEASLGDNINDTLMQEDKSVLQTGALTRNQQKTDNINNPNSVEGKQTMQKKTVTFGSVLESFSDGSSAKKCSFNRDVPLVSIIKKSSFKVSKNDSIVKPSKLTEISAKYATDNIKTINCAKLKLSGNECLKETSGAVGGFVLPVRSAHSSRVIKPNKRFIETEETKISRSGKLNLKKPRLVLIPRDALATDEAYETCDSASPHSSEATDDSSDARIEWKTLRPNVDKSVFTSFNVGRQFVNKSETNTESSRHFSNLCFSEQSSSESQSESALSSDSESGSETDLEGQRPFSPRQNTGKVILRKATLQLQAQANVGTEGPFSITAVTNTATPPTPGSPPGTVTCGVCGAVRFYKFVRQARKFGIYTCESCRKFISKMVKRQSVTPSSSDLNMLQCHKGEGTCHVPPIVRSHQWKLNYRCAYKARCPACWLKLCLRSFHIPGELRAQLLATLPANIRETVEKNMCNPDTDTTPVVASNKIFPSCLKKNIDKLPAESENPVPTNKVFGVEINSNAVNRLQSWSQDVPSDGELVVTGLESSEKEITATKSPDRKVLVTEIDHLAVKKRKRLHTKVRKKDKVTVAANNVEVSKRQKIELRGPRVKHVCRSASVVLGQPIATFPQDTETELETIEPETIEQKIPVLVSETKLVKEPEPTALEEDKLCADSTEPVASEPLTSDILPNDKVSDVPITEINLEVSEVPATEITVADCNIGTDDNVLNNNNNVITDDTKCGIAEPDCLPILDDTVLPVKNPVSISCLGPKKTAKAPIYVPAAPNYRSQQQVSKRSVPSAPLSGPLISIDFWENYDPVEVSRTGFGLIGSEPFTVQALCFLCGSRGDTNGSDPLVFCTCCCEPYHQYCVEDELINCVKSVTDVCGDISSMDVSLGLNRSYNYQSVGRMLSWLCPRCTVCQSCGLTSGTKLSCQKCYKNYHSTCLGNNKRQLGSDRPFICSPCLKCKSCGTSRVTKYLGNMPMCSPCFKLRQKGNYCPLCQRCYEDNDYDTKMMECGDCKRWVHAHCEGLTNEKYQVLSTLPESVEYVCRKCSVDTNAPWREAVDLELRNGFLGVLRGMSKNRKACALLKWSPRKKTICVCQPIESVKRIQFAGDKESESSKRVSAGKDINNLREVMCMEKSDADPNSCLKDVIDLQDQNSSSVKELSDEQEMENAILSIEGDKLDSGNCSTDEELMVKMPSQDVESDSELTYSKKENFVCYCQKQSWQAVPTLLDIKKKVTHDEYPSLQQFNSDMMEAIEAANCEELLTVYRKIVCDSFPWFTNRPHENVRTEDDNTEEFADVDKDNVNSNTECKDQEVPSMISADDFEDYFYEDNHHVEDTRSCLFCKGDGDGLPLHEARLLYCGQNEWVHANCALWSAEVFEEIDGSLQNVHSAVSRGRMIRCSSCAMKGASVGCCAKNCSETYHYSCARRINCAFMDDKTVYCPTHSDEERPKKLRQHEKDFEIRRPVYVELDRKKKKFSEISRVQFIVGSLLVKNIGKFIPVLSDHIDGIVPSDFLCTRLFWSTKEPWKIVQYTIKTTVQVFRPQPNCTLGKNLTVDHSLSPTEVQKQLSEVVRWHKSVENEESSPVNTSDNNMRIKSSDDNTVKHILDQIIDAACKNDSDDICDEETHNTDLLPPELEDAIFEDLPHDLLDGISMLDILPKLMSYEDLIAMDIKNEVCFGGDLLKEKDDFSDTKSESECLDKCKKVSSDNADADWIDTKTSDLIDDLLQTTTKVGGQELKRSKSEVFPSNLSQLKSIASGRSQQRSCSLTWSCKMDGSINVKRRKLARTSQSGQSGGMFLDMSDKNHMLQELRLPEGVLVTLGRPDTVKELKYRLEEDSVINSERRRSVSHQLEEGKENKCLLWQSRSQPRLLQVDGPGDSSSSGSEGGSPPRIPEDLKISQLDGADDMSSSGSESGSPEHQTEMECPLIQHKYAPSCNETILLNNDMPVKCNRCHCTYRTQDSYERHLETCEMITSESDSDTPRSPESDKDNPAINTDAVLLVQNVTSNAYISEAQKQINQQNVCSISIPMQTSIQSQPTISIVPNFNIPGLVQQSHPLTYNNGLLQTSYQVSPFNQCNNGLQNVVIDSNQLQSHDHTQMQTLQLANIQQNHQQIIPQSVHPQNLPAHFQNTMVQCSTDGSHYQQPMIQNNVNVPNSINIQSCPQNQSRIITLSNPQISQQYQQSVFQSPQNVRSVSNSASYQAVPTVITIGNQQITTSPPKQQLILPQNMRSPPKRQVVARSGAPVVNARGRGRGNSRINVTKRILKPDKPIIVNQNISVARPQTSNVVYQQPNNQNSIILQQMQNPNVISYVEAIQQQNGNVQYIATIAPAENEYKQPTQYLTPNPLIPGTFQLHTDTGNLFLTNGGLSMLPSGIQLAQSHPTVLGTLIQPPGQTLQCGMMAEQMLLGATPGLEMVTDSSGCVYLTSQPMYYGLETIVQNTVMSSQQFVSSAMQGVLSSNSSFSATTTQVFQASKIEPMCEVPTGYVVVNNLPSDNAVQASITLQPTSVQTPCQTTLTQNQTNNTSSNNNLPWRYTMHTPEQHNIVQISPPKVNIAPKQQMILSKMPSQLIHKVLPSSSQQMSENVLKTNQGRNAVRNLQFKSLNPQTFQMTQNNNSMTLQYSNSKPSLGNEKSTIHHMQNSCKPLTSASNQQSILLNHVDSINTQTNPGKHLEEILANTIDRLSLPTPNVNVQMSPHQTPMSNNQHATSNVTLSASNMQNTCSIQLPTAPYAQPHQSGIPTNIVNPIQQVNVQNVNPTPARPMNRVLPMQTSIHRDSPIVPFPNSRVSPDIKLKSTPKDIVIESITTLRPKPKPKEVKGEPIQFKSSLPKGGKLENTSLKMIFQKQSPNGCYKISNKNMESHQPDKVLPAKSSFEPLNSLNLNMIQKQVLHGFPEQTPARKLSNSKHVGMENTLNRFKLGKKPKDNAPKMLYEVQSQDGFSYTSSSITELWKKVMDSVQNARRANNMPTLPEISANALTGIQLLGLHNNAMKYLVEQLPGANKCVKYKPKFHKLSAEDSEYETVFDLLKENAYGAGRCEPYMDRSEYDMFSWLASRHRQRPTATAQSDSEIAAIRRATSTNLPMAMRFRYLKETSKEAVGVFRSLIHGRGLFCRRDIEAGEMVIEYAGEVIRATLTDQREKYYDSKGIGCYMFRIDDHLVVDATMRGNAARFINHSCEPNCYSRVVDILGHKHIIIFALRRILQGEELTYDYKFPFEDVKIPCTCGSRKCRKYLN